MFVTPSQSQTHSITVLVSMHKPAASFESRILRPIQVGAKNAAHRMENMLHDDEGDNISELNPSYCELTAQYWAWKHVDADYIGFCHYRRYFDLSGKAHAQNPYGEIVAEAIDASSQLEYGLDDSNIMRFVEGNDVIVTEIKDLRKMAGRFSTPREHYQAARHLNDRDFDLMIETIGELAPDYAQDADAYLAGNHSCFCNMFIMKRELFQRYCAWLFPILEATVVKMNTETYSIEGLRTPGHLAERLLNIFLIHERRVDNNLRLREIPCVLFQNTQPNEPAAHKPVSAGPGQTVIPIALAANDEYVPMLTTTLYSVVANTRPSCLLDVLILERDIPQQRKDVIASFFSAWDNVTISFCDVSTTIAHYNLSTANKHISVETYYRFMVQDLFADYDKAIYLDSDLVVAHDIEALFKIELGQHLIAAARDLDFLGNIGLKDGKRLNYARNTLGMSNPYGYFQAGVLLMNLKELRRLHSVSEWLEIASQPGYLYDDQDILNVACEGRVKYLDASWNVMTDFHKRSSELFSFAPAQAYRDYLAARKEEKVVHYAGPEKPWNCQTCDRKEVFWGYARMTPFYEELLEKLWSSTHGARYKTVRFLTDEDGLKRIVEPLAPAGTKRGNAVRRMVNRLR